MVNTRLEIGSQENIGYYTDIPVNLIYQISDVSKPDKRVSTGSLTIKIPFSRESNILFENIFEANIDLQTFNPNLKEQAKYRVSELIVFKGYAQLLKINVDERTGEGWYEISLVGELLNIYTDINGRLLTDLDFSAYDHDLDYAQITGSWGASGSGFVYPIIDWGTNNSNLAVIRPIDLRGCYFVREYLQKIFSDANYTWTSTFLDSSYFSKLIIPPTKAPVLDPGAVNDGKFLAVANGSQTISVSPYSLPGNNLLFTSNITTPVFNPVNFQTETYDQNNIFTTPNFTVPYTTSYNLACKMNINFTVTRNAVDVSANIANNTSGIHVVIYNTTTAAVAGTYDITPSTFSLAPANSNQCSVNLNNISLIAGHVYQVDIRFFSINLAYNAATSGATWLLNAKILSGSTFSVEFVSDAVFEGGTVPGNSLIPQGVRQTDFITGIIKMFNLYMMVDKSNPRNYIIEPRDTFYLNTPIDWTQKHDYNSNTEIKPLAEADAKDYRFTYKSDGDYFNKLYSDYYKNRDGSAQVYGTHETSITNDFLNNLNVTEVIFSPTPYSSNSTSELVVPTIVKKENSNIAEFNSNIRILYYSGQITAPGLSWKFLYNNGSSSVVYNTYPQAGHTDNPFAPTLDLNWGLPVKTYYTYPNLQWTTNNLFNARHSRFLAQISDPNSRLVVTDFWLAPHDVNRFDFRYPVNYMDSFNNQAYYIVNKFNYNPVEEETTRAELLKLIAYDPFTPSTYNHNSNDTEDHSWNKVKLDNIVIGPNNFNESETSSIVGGNDNFISNSSDSCTLTNCQYVTVVGAENFTGSNIVGPITIDSSYSNTKLNGDDTSVTITTDTTLDRTYKDKTVYVDASSGDVTITWDIQNMQDCNVTIFRKDSSVHIVYLDSTSYYGTESYRGNPLPYDLVTLGSVTPFDQYASIKLTSNSDTIYNL